MHQTTVIASGPRAAAAAFVDPGHAHVRRAIANPVQPGVRRVPGGVPA